MTVNVPLLRKAVEWAEAEAAKPEPQCEWVQSITVLNTTDPGDLLLRENFGKAPECGTCYCIAGYVASINLGLEDPYEAAEGRVMLYAAGVLGIDPLEAEAGLFHPFNTIADVRRIAEEIVGGPL